MCMYFFLNWQFTFYPFLMASVRSSAGCSLHQLSPLRRGSSCTLHPGCAPCTLGSIGVVKGGQLCLSLIHCWLISHTHTYTHSHKHLLSRSFAHSHSWEAAETPGWGVRDDGQWVPSGGGNLTGLPTRWKHSASLLLLLLLPLSFYHLHAHFFQLSFCFLALFLCLSLSHCLPLPWPL